MTAVNRVNVMDKRLLSRDECLALLKSVRLGRVCVTVKALPAIYPVCFSVFDGSVIFSTGANPAMAAATDGKVVAFEADSCGSDPKRRWSIMGVGIATRVEATDGEQLMRLRFEAIEGHELSHEALRPKVA